MNASQIHLALNHVPLFFSIIGGLILLYGFLRRNNSFKILSLYFMIGAALFIIPVYITGEGTEEMVEDLPGISESLIHEHEEIAKISLIVIIITGVAAFVSLVIKNKSSLLKISLVICAILSFSSFGLMAQAAHLGGQIRHSEIRTGAMISSENENTSKESDERKKDGKESDND